MPNPSKSDLEVQLEEAQREIEQLRAASNASAAAVGAGGGAATGEDPVPSWMRPFMQFQHKMFTMNLKSINKIKVCRNANTDLQ